MSDKLTVTSKSSNADLKAYLDQEGLEYGSKYGKPELLALAGVDVNAEAIAMLTDRMDASDEEVKSLKSENKNLVASNTKLAGDNKKLASEVSKLSKSTSADSTKKAEKPKVPTKVVEFIVDGEVKGKYKYNIARFIHPITKQPVNASDVLEDTELLEFLVTKKSAVIKEC